MPDAQYLHQAPLQSDISHQDEKLTCKLLNHSALVRQSHITLTLIVH